VPPVVIGGQVDEVPLKLMTVYGYNSEIFALIAMFMQKSSCDKYGYTLFSKSNSHM